MATVSHAFAQNKIETALDRWYFTALALALIAISIAGFAPSVVATEDRRAPLSMLATVHGIVFFLWQILFLAQSLLIANRRVDLHRRMGVIAGCVLAFMIPLGYATTVTMARRGFDLSGDLKVDRHSHGMYVDPLLGMLFPLTDLAVFGLLAAAALAYRRRKEIHMRLMVFANIVLMPAAMAHLIGHSPRLSSIAPPMTTPLILIPLSILLASVVLRDYFAARRVHPLTWALAISLLAWGPIRASLIGPSTAWHKVAARLIR